MKKICLLLILPSGPCFADSDKGEAPLEAGDYSTALKGFRPPADDQFISIGPKAWYAARIKSPTTGNRQLRKMLQPQRCPQQAT